MLRAYKLNSFLVNQNQVLNTFFGKQDLSVPVLVRGYCLQLLSC